MDASDLDAVDEVDDAEEEADGARLRTADGPAPRRRNHRQRCMLLLHQILLHRIIGSGRI